MADDGGSGVVTVDEEIERGLKELGISEPVARMLGEIRADLENAYRGGIECLTARARTWKASAKRNRRSLFAALEHLEAAEDVIADKVSTIDQLRTERDQAREEVQSLTAENYDLTIQRDALRKRLEEIEGGARPGLRVRAGTAGSEAR